MRRFFIYGKPSRHPNNRINLIATITLVSILSSILLFITNKHQNDRVFKSFCGGFGLSASPWFS